MAQVYYKNSKLCLGYFLYEIAHHCNINCASCDHCAPLAKKEFVDFKIFQADIRKMSEIFSHIDTIGIMGGEPLLNKDVLKILEYTRKIFPLSNIVLFTNGTLLLNQPKSFWETLYKNKIIVLVTVYRLKINYKKMKEIAQKYKVNINFKLNLEFCKAPFDLTGNQNNNERIKDCYQANHCATLENGKLFRCSVVTSSKHFNEFFSQNLKIDNYDFIDIHKKSLNDEQIVEYFLNPIPFCRYCKLDERKNIVWEYSKKKIEEWT